MTRGAQICYPRGSTPLTLEGLRAIMRYSDNPASLVGSIAGNE